MKKTGDAKPAKIIDTNKKIDFWNMSEQEQKNLANTMGMSLEELKLWLQTKPILEQ